MAKSVFRHHEDDGLLSVFASDAGEILLACEKGHWWIVDATSSGTARPEQTPANDANLKVDMPMKDLLKRFGPDSLRALHPK